MCGGERCGDFRCSKVQTITSPNTICNNKRFLLCRQTKEKGN